MKWSWTVGRFWGTELRLHTSMLLLVPYVLLSFRPTDFWDAVRVLLLIAGVFACVALHEAGHTAAARFFGIEVKNITLWPLGGFASLSRQPEKTLHNLVIVAAGPLVNLVLTMGFLLLILLERLVWTAGSMPEVSVWMQRLEVFPFLAGLAATNLALALFNLIPIYPLDGGQITRDLLKLVFGERRADQILIFFSLPLALGVLFLGFSSRDPLVILTGGLLLLASATLNARAATGLNLAILYLTDRGGYFLRREDYEEAITAYTAALRRRPNRAGLHVNRAVAYLSMMDFRSARADLEQALALDPNLALAWLLRGELHDLAGETTAAFDCFHRSIALRPDFALAYADRGSLFQKTGDLRRAGEDLDRAVSLGQQLTVVRILRSVYRYQVGDPAGAMADAEHALRFAPQWMLVFPEIFLDNFRGHPGWVLAYYNQAVERHPAAYQAYQGRADALRVNDRLDWAIADYNRAIHHSPAQPALYLNRAKTFLALGQTEKAAADLRDVLQRKTRPHLRRQAEALLAQIESAAAPPEPGSTCPEAL